MVPKVAMAMAVVALSLGLFYEWNSFDPEQIRGNRVLITGASSGIGEELAYQYSKLGAALVVITARRETLLRDVARKCKELGAGKVVYVATDISKEKGAELVANKTKELLGDKGLDILILNHAVFSHKPFLKSSQNISDFRRDVDINYVSYVDVASHMLGKLIESRGRIAIVSSIVGKIPSSTMPSYSSQKFALHGFFGALHQELKQRDTGVTVTFAVLGYIKTETARTIRRTHYVDITEEQMYPGEVLDTALAIMLAVYNRHFEMYYPRMLKLLAWVHRFFPETVEHLLGQQIKSFDL